MSIVQFYIASYLTMDIVAKNSHFHTHTHISTFSTCMSCFGRISTEARKHPPCVFGDKVLFPVNFTSRSFIREPTIYLPACFLVQFRVLQSRVICKEPFPITDESPISTCHAYRMTVQIGQIGRAKQVLNAVRLYNNVRLYCCRICIWIIFIQPT